MLQLPFEIISVRSDSHLAMPTYCACATKVKFHILQYPQEWTVVKVNDYNSFSIVSVDDSGW